MTTTLDEVFRALHDDLRGPVGEQTLDLAAAAAKAPLTGLRAVLDLFTIGNAFALTTASVSQSRASVVAAGDGSLAVKPGGEGAPKPLPTAVAARLTVTEAGTDVAYELALTISADSWTFTATFPTLAPTLRPDETGNALVYGKSVLSQVNLTGVALTGLTGDKDLRITGALQPTGAVSPYQDWVSPWPLTLAGRLGMPADASAPPALEASATTFGELPIEPTTLHGPGFGIRSVVGLDPAQARVSSFSELTVVGTLDIGKQQPVRADIRAPLLVSNRTWRLNVAFDPYLTLSRALAAIAELFDVAPDAIAVAPGLTGLDTFGLAMVETVISRKSGGFSLDSLAITIESPPNTFWDAPIPFVKVGDLGTRWVLSFVTMGGTTRPVVGGSVYGSIQIGSGTDAPVIDLSAQLPAFVITGDLRSGTSIPVGQMFTHFFGHSGPPTPDSDGKPMAITRLSLVADPRQQRFAAAAEIELSWPLPFVNNLRLTGLVLFIDAAPSRLGGGIAGTLTLGTGDDPAGQPAMTLSAELPPGEAGGWIFTGELLAGVPLTARHLVGLFVSSPPQWLGALAITALRASVDTGRQTWSFEGAIELGFTVEILQTSVTIGAGAELELAKTTATGTPAGKLTGFVSVNRLYLEVRRDIGIDDPTWAIRVQFGELWVQGTTLWRGQGTDKHQAVAIQLGGVTLGGLLEYLVNLAAPTLGFRLDPPWDLLKRVDLARFTLTIDPDPKEKSIELTYAADVDLGIGTVSKIGVRYQLGAQRKVDLILEGTLLGKSFTGADALRWDVIDGTPPTVPGQGESMLVVRYLGLGQRVRLKNPPDTVTAAIEGLTRDMRPAKPGANPIKGSAMVYDAASQWLVGLDLSVLGTVDVALIFADPGLYGLSIGLRGERAGPLAGLRFEVLYKKLAGGIGMFRIELRLPDQFRRIELGAVSITLGIVVIEIYTNGNFLVDLGFPHGRNFDRSFSLSYFPFIGRGGFYLGVLNGTTSRRVPQITNGTFSPVLELGIGIAVGVGKELAMGPLRGGAYVEVQVIFEGVFAWFNPSAEGAATALYYRGQGIAAIHGKVYAEVDFLVVKASVTLEAYAQASVTFEAYRPTLFALQVSVRAEAKIKILFITISFSFRLQLDASITVGSVSPTPWAVAPVGGPGGMRVLAAAGLPAARRNHRRLLAVQIAAIEQLRFDWQPGLVLPQVTPAELSMLPAFSVAGPPIDWTLPHVGRIGAQTPDWRVAFLLFAGTGDAGPAATLVELLLRWSLKATRGTGGTPGLLTAGQLQALTEAMQTRAVADEAFSLANLTALLQANVRLAISGDGAADESDDVEAVALPLPPFLTISFGDTVVSNLSTDHRIGPLYAHGASQYMADFSPVRDGAGPPPADNPATYESFASYAFRDWCLMTAREAVRQAQLGLAGHTVIVGDRSLDAVAADPQLPRDEIDYVVQPGDTIATVAAHLGAGLLELQVLNPRLEAELAAAVPGTSLPVTVGVAGATLVLDNPAEPMLADTTVELTGLRVAVRPGDTLSTIARRLYGPAGDPLRLVADARLADRRVLLAGATFAVPARTAPLPGVATALLAGIFYVRYYADTQVPETEWYAQAIAGIPANAQVLDTLEPGHDIPAGSALLVPAAANSTDTISYTTVPGDTLLRLGAALSLAQAPDAYAEPAWQAFRARVTGADVPAMPALAIQPGESLQGLATRLVLPAEERIATLVGWLANAPVLTPLAILEPSSVPFATKGLSLAGLATAAGLTLDELAARAEVTGATGLFPADAVLRVAHLPAQRVDALVTSGARGTGLAAVITHVSRQLLSGTRLPKPVPETSVDDGRTVRADGPLTGLAELTGQQLAAPPLDGSTAFAATVTKVAGDNLDWLAFTGAKAPTALDFAATNEQLSQRYPSARLPVAPVSGPAPIPVAGEVVRTYGLGHRIELQGGIGLQIPAAVLAGVPEPGGNPTLWRLPADAIAKARAGSSTPWTLARADDGTGVADHSPIPNSTFGTIVSVTVRRLPGPLDLGLYELLGADTADRDLLLALALAARSVPVGSPPMAVRLGVAPAPDAGDPSGIALLDANPEATFVVRANMATDVRLTAPPQTLVATLASPASFLQLLWEASVAQGGGFHLGLAVRQGLGLPAGVFADDGTATLWLLAITGQQQQPAPGGRRLQPTDNCALVAAGLDATAQSLYLEAADPAEHPDELVKQAVIPAGSGGITLVLPPAPNPTGLPDPAAAEARARQLFSLLLAEVSGAYANKDHRSAPPAPPQHDDGTNRPAWQRHRAEQARRIARLTALAAGEPPPSAAADLPSLWRYDQVIPLFQDGPPSVVPAVAGLPAPAGDPYRGFGGSSPASTATATFEIGFADVLGNVTAQPPAPVHVTMGYTDPLLAPGTWPGATTGWGLSTEDGQAVLTVALSAQTATFVPAPGADVRLAAEAAGHQAAKHAEASYQLAQPTVGASILTTLRQDGSGAPLVQPVREGSWPLWRFTAAGSLFAAACANAAPAFAAGRASTVGELNTATGLGFATLGSALAELPAASLLSAGTPLTATARLVSEQGDTASAIVGRIPAGWPRPADAAALLTDPANATMPLRPGVVVSVPPVSLPPLPTPATDETLQKVADAHRSTPEQLALDNDDQPVLRQGFLFTAAGVQVAVGAGVRSFAQVRGAFAALGVDVATTELARANHDVRGIFADAAVLRLEHVVAGNEATLQSLAGAQLDAVAGRNTRTPDLFLPGTLVVLGDWLPAPVVPSGAEQLGQLATRLGCSLGQLLRDNAGLQLAGGGAKVPLPGVAAPLADAVALGADVRVPYGIQRGTSLDEIAGRFGTTAQALAAANAGMPGLLGLASVTVTVSGGSASTDVRPGDSLDAILARLRQQQAAVTLADLVSTIAANRAALAVDALLVCPAPTLAAPVPADAAAPFGVSPAALVQANAALLGLVRPDVTLTVTGPGSDARVSTRTVAHDTVNAILGRFAEAGVPVDIAGLLAQNPTAALLETTRVLLPPPPMRVSVGLGAKAGPFASPTFPLTTTLRLQRERGAVHPELRTEHQDGPVERAESIVPAPAVPKPGTDTHTFDAFIDACAAVLPELRLATSRVEGETADLWAANFGAAGIASVHLMPGVTYPDGSTQPRYFALRPLYPELQSRTELAVRRLTEDGTLGPVALHEVQGIDVETWARRLLADLDLYLTAPYVAGMYRRGTASRAALTKLLQAKWRIADALADGLAPVLASVASGSRPGHAVDPHGAAGLVRAVDDLAASGGVSLAATYDVATIVQYDSAVTSAYSAPGTTLRPARLTGPATPPADNATDFTLTNGAAELDKKTSFVSLALTVPVPARQTSVKTGALDLGFDTLDFDLRQVSGADSYEACERLTFVRPLTGAYQPAAIVDDLGSPVVPVPLRAHPPLPIIAEQSAAKTWQGEQEPSLEQASQWTFAVSWSHEHAAQDEILLTVTFNVVEPDVRLLAQGLDLAAALGAYTLIADEVRERMAAYVLPAGQQPAAADNLATSLSTIVEPIAEAWAGHWPAPPGPVAEPPAAAAGADGVPVDNDRYGFRVAVAFQSVSGDLDHVTLTLDGQDSPGPTRAWPELSWRLADGSFVALLPSSGGPSGGALRYLPEAPIKPMGWPTLRAAWPGLNVASTQNARASLAVRRNEHLLGPTGVRTNPAFVLGTAQVTAPDIAVPLLEWNLDLALERGDLRARLEAAFSALFSDVRSAPVTLALGYAFPLVPAQDGMPGSGIISEMPVALLPNALLSEDPAGKLADIAAVWPHQTASDAFWSVSVSLASSLSGAPARPLLTLVRLLVPVQT